MTLAFPALLLGVVLATRIPTSSQRHNPDHIPTCNPEDLEHCLHGFSPETCQCLKAPEVVLNGSATTPVTHDTRQHDPAQDLHPPHQYGPPRHTIYNCIHKYFSCLEHAKTCLWYGCKDCIVRTLSCTQDSMNCMVGILNHGGGCSKPHSRTRRQAGHPYPPWNHVCLKFGRRCRRGPCWCRHRFGRRRTCTCRRCCRRHGPFPCKHHCLRVSPGRGNCRCTGRRCRCYNLIHDPFHHH